MDNKKIPGKGRKVAKATPESFKKKDPQKGKKQTPSLEKFYKENKKKKREDYKIKEKKKETGPKRGFEKKPAFEEMPLNKYIAKCGICSRREAVDHIKKGEVKVNGKEELNPAYRVQFRDKITYKDVAVQTNDRAVYFLLNKPKNYITTTNDPRERRTVMDLFRNIKERIYPVGRLDRNTTGLLLLTNDGDVAQKLSHPKYSCKKIYQVSLNKSLEATDYDKIKKGVILEDGKATVDDLQYIDEKKNLIGIEIHIGKNRIVRRIFEHLGYEVKHLDRVMYAGLTKKNLPRGKWRALTRQEIIYLKHFK